MTAPTPPPSPTHHPSPQCSVDCMTDILSPPPPPQHTHTHRSASQSCVDCTTVLPVCVQRPAVLTFQRTAPSISENRCTNSAHETSSSTAAAYDWVVNMDCVDSRSQTLDCQALRQLLRNLQPRRNSRRNGYRDSGKFLIVIG